MRIRRGPYFVAFGHSILLQRYKDSIQQMCIEVFPQDSYNRGLIGVSITRSKGKFVLFQIAF